MATKEHFGHAGLTGWREKVADALAPPVARKGPLSEGETRAIVGGLFFLLSAWYVATTIRRMVKAARDCRGRPLRRLPRAGGRAAGRRRRAGAARRPARAGPR